MSTLIIDPLKPFGAKEIAEHSGVDHIVTPSTGTNHIDRAACSKAGIKVSSLLDDRERLETIRASSEFTFLLVLAAIRNLGKALREVDEGRWLENRRLLRGNEVYGKTVGLIGYGRIGQNMERYFHAFDVESVHWHDPYKRPPNSPDNFEQIFAHCDIVVVCCSLTEDTKGMVRGRHIRSMKDGAVLVNTSRVEVLDEVSVASALDGRPDIRAALDVLTGEVSGRQHLSPLMGKNNVLITPHIAGCTYESEAKAKDIAKRLADGE